MAFFKNKDLKLLEAQGFITSETLFKAPGLALLPSLYVDEKNKKIAVKLPNGEPQIFSFEDLLEAAIVEDTSAPVADSQEYKDAVFARPGVANRANAAAKDHCLGLAVVLKFKHQTSSANLPIPFITQTCPRSSVFYTKSLENAHALVARLSALVQRELTDEKSQNIS